MGYKGLSIFKAPLLLKHSGVIISSCHFNFKILIFVRGTLLILCTVKNKSTWLILVLLAWLVNILFKTGSVMKGHYVDCLIFLKQAKHVRAAPGEARQRSAAYWSAERLHCGFAGWICHPLWWEQGHREGKYLLLQLPFSVLLKVTIKAY